MPMSSYIWIPDNTNWLHPQDKIYSMFADLSNVAHEIFSIMAYSVRARGLYFIVWYITGWIQSKTRGKTLRKRVVVRQFAHANKGILAGDDPSFEYEEDYVWPGNEESGGGKQIANNGHCPHLSRDEVGKPKPMCYYEQFMCSHQSDNIGGILFKFWWDHKSSLVKVLIWWRGCIHIVREITIATSLVCNRHPWRKNWKNICPPNQKNWLSRRPKRWGVWTQNNFGYWELAWLELRLG